jgi:hypothetical protein
MGVPVASRQTASPQRADQQRSLSHPGSQAAACRETSPIARLQRSVGNRAINRLLRSQTIQPKLTVSHPDDPYEREADRVSDEVMRRPEPLNAPQHNDEEKERLIQRKTYLAQSAVLSRQEKCTACSSGKQACPKCAEGESLQRKTLAGTIAPLIQRKYEKVSWDEESSSQKDSSGREISPPITDNINSLIGGGQPLPAATRSFFEPRFGADFSGVRVHAHSEAAQVASSVNAKAFTLGRDLVFGAGQYSPETTGGKKLLAHELTHVIQQGSGRQATNQSLQSPVLQQSPNPKIMRKGFESTIEVCHRVLETRNFEITNGGLRVVLNLRRLDKSVPDCTDFDFGVTLTKSRDWWPDKEIGTCMARTGGTRTFLFGDISSGTHYLTVWRIFDHPYCCLEGDILVFDEPVSGDSAGCKRGKDLSVMDIVHGALDVAGFIPALGAIPDGLNAVIYAAEGDWTNAGISAIAMVPLFGDGAKLGIKAGEEVIEVSGKTILKMGEKELTTGLEKVAAHKVEKAAAGKIEKEVAGNVEKEIAGNVEKEAAQKLEKEAAQKLEREAAEKALKKKIAECEAIWAAYKALGECRKCLKSDTPAERALKVACITGVLAGRRKYLKEKCDYVLAGSIAKGSANAEKGHEQAAAQLVKMLADCASLPTS